MGEAGLAKWKMKSSGPVEVDVVGDVVLHEHEVAAGQVLDVGEVAGEQVVHPHHGEAAGRAGDSQRWEPMNPAAPVTRARGI